MFLQNHFLQSRNNRHERKAYQRASAQGQSTTRNHGELLGRRQDCYWDGVGRAKVGRSDVQEGVKKLDEVWKKPKNSKKLQNLKKLKRVENQEF